MGVRGHKSKIEENSFVECHMRTNGSRMSRFHRETKKRRSNLKEQRDRQTDRQSQRQKIIDSLLGAEINTIGLQNNTVNKCECTIRPGKAAVVRAVITVP